MYRRVARPSLGKYLSGFSLMEMAIVLMIMGILMSGVLVSVSQTTLNARRATALSQLRQIEEAIYGYAQSTGRLPCPAKGDNGGLEDCTLTHGFVPSTTISFEGAVNDDNLLLDPWQNPYRYSVDPDYVTIAGIQNMFAAVTSAMRVCAVTGCTAANAITDIAPAVILTMGEDWSNTTSAAEQDNADNATLLTGGVTGNSYFINGDDSFTSSGYVEDQFDDQLVWLSPYVLFNRMVSAGRSL